MAITTSDAAHDPQAFVNLPEFTRTKTIIALHSDENRLGEEVPARFSFDALTRWVVAERQVIDRQRKQPEVIAMWAVAMRWAGTTVTWSPEIVGCLFEALLAGVPGSAFGQLHTIGRNVIGRPVMPDPRRGVEIIAEKDKTAGSCRSAGPAERRGKVLTVASETPRDRRTVRKAI
ncbi:hypothetical protein AJ88_13150 [Mesorhizobium amorphae CCBAU 01583]|nr:hypothetical protein AJ88_13150 [Mesorhizobium amorphae CCBAU 01583]